MGIERFFSAINRNFNVVDNVENINKIKCNALLIDFNSIIHNISSILIKKLNSNELDDKYKNTKLEDIENIIIDEVKNYLIELIQKIDCNLIYIALDGVPTFSKILEQKKRRFIGDFIENLISKYSLPFSFSKSLISPGTIFMDNMINKLREIKFPINTIISDVNEKGEGEFKILDYISNKKLDDVIIYSPDADLIILSMILWAQKNIKIKILRYDQNTNVLNLIYINTLIDYFIDYSKDRIIKKINSQKYILDLCFIFTIFGNDFLPKIENININMDLYLILDGYIINNVDYDYILDDKYNIIPKTLFNYFVFLSRFENYLLKRNANLYRYQNFNYANQVNLYLDIKNKKFNMAMLFYLDFGNKININSKYGKLEYYFYKNEKLIKMLDDITYKNNFNQEYIDKNLRYQKKIEFEYNSKIKKHLIAMKEMSDREKELYLIDKKLDKYYTLFNPNNKFYISLSKSDYYKNNNPKQMVKEYLNGFKWLINYYFVRDKIDEYWFYKYHHSPLITDFVNFFNKDEINYNFNNKSLNINPLEQLVYISPIKNSNISDFIKIINTTKENKDKIEKFIKNNMNLFYNLDEIYYAVTIGNLTKDLFDCSNATFISKCHYFILDHVQPINQFKIL